MQRWLVIEGLFIRGAVTKKGSLAIQKLGSHRSNLKLPRLAAASNTQSVLLKSFSWWSLASFLLKLTTKTAYTGLSSWPSLRSRWTSNRSKVQDLPASWPSCQATRGPNYSCGVRPHLVSLRSQQVWTSWSPRPPKTSSRILMWLQSKTDLTFAFLLSSKLGLLSN